MEQVREILHEAAQTGGFIVHTLVSEELRHLILVEGRFHNVDSIDLMGPLLASLAELLKIQPRSVPGLFDSSYMQRIEAIDYTVRHDDGRNIHDLDRAEIVLIGVSRTAKTPLSIYLANRGWRVANIPIILGIDPPAQLFQLPRKRVVGLILKPERLVDLRKSRVEKMGTNRRGYADLDHIRREVAYFYQLLDRRRDWPVLDVTTKPIEETASEVVSLIGASDRGLNGV